MNFSYYHEDIRIQSLDTGIISEKPMSEKQIGQKRKRMEKQIRGSQLGPESEFLYRTKIVTNNIVNNFESFKHGNSEERI